MKKRLLSAILSIVMLLTLLPVSAFAATTVASGHCGGEGDGTNLTWTLDSDGLLTISGTGAMKDYDVGGAPWYSERSRIKSVIIGNSVTSIGAGAFGGCNSVTSATLPDSVKSIGDYAFDSCLSLTSITIPNGVTSIGFGAFYACHNLTSITIPNSVTSIGNAAFHGCKKLTNITIPDGVTNIGAQTFWECEALRTVIIGNGVKSIGGQAFWACLSLKKVIIPNSVASIDEWAFRQCSSLTSITIPSSVTTIGDGAFSYCFDLTDIYYNGTEAQWNALKYSIDSNNEPLLNATIHFNYVPSGNVSSGHCGGEGDGTNLTWTLGSNGTLTISGTGQMPNWVHESNVPWYSNRTDITSVTISSGVTSIGDYAFHGEFNLAGVTIPNSVTRIGDYSFAGCSDLAAVSIGSNVKNIGNYAFYRCAALTGITIPSSVRTIGEYAFSECDSLSVLTMKSGVTSIGAWAFGECSNLTGSVVIPSSVTTIGDHAFCACSITAVTIPDGVTSIGSCAFYNCGRLSDVKLGNGVTSISDSMFCWCSNLTDMTIPDSVTSIEGSAFSWCGFKSLTIPNSVMGIGSSAFASCSRLTDVYYTGTEAQWNALSVNIGSDNDFLLGAAIHYNASPLAKAPSSFVPSGKYRITVVSPDSMPIEGATVTWKDDFNNITRQTAKDGSVLFDKTSYGSLQLSVSESGFITWTNAGSFWSKSANNQETVVLYPTTMSNLKLAVARYSNSSSGDGQDILTHTKSISLGNDAFATGDLDFGNFYLKCSAVSPDAAQSYALWQGSKKIAESASGDFGKLNSASFAAGGNCFVLVTGKDGKSVDTGINLIFSKSSVNSADEISFGGKGFSIKVGDDVPFLGGSTVDFDLPFKIPLTFCATDESIAIGFNADIGKSDTEKEIRKKYPGLDDKAVKEKVKQKDLDDLRKTLENVKKAKNTNIDKNTKENLQSLMKERNKKAKLYKEVDMSVIGCAEANWGSSTATGEIAFVVDWSAFKGAYNTAIPVFVIFIPVTVEFDVTIGAKATGRIIYDWEHAIVSGDATLAPSIELKAFGGVGVSELAGAGAYGGATLDGLIRVLGTPAGLRSVDLTGELGIKAYIGLLEGKKAFAYNTWHLYTANSTKAMLMSSQSAGAPLQAELYDASTYHPHDLSYLTEESPWLGEASPRLRLMAAGSGAAKTELTSLLENTYRNAQPTATTANGDAYAAFLRADENGNIYTAATKYDGTSWKTPVRADNASVLDNAPSLCTDANGTVWLAYTQTDASADKTSLLSYANAQTLVVGTVDADTLAFTKVAEYTGSYIHMAKLTLVDGSPVLVWAESAVETDNDVLMPQESMIYTAKQESYTWRDKQLLAEIDTPLYELVPSDGADVLRVACLVDSDGDVTTANDTELREGSSVLAEGVRHIGYAKLPNESEEGYIWIRDGVLCSEAGTELAGVVSEYSATDSAVFFSNPDANLSVYKYTDGAWSEAITLTEDERYLEDLTALETAYGEVVLGMNTKATITENAVTDEKNLVWSRVTAVNDLRVEYVDFDDKGIAAGEDIAVTLGVTNAGDHTVSALSLMLNDVEQTVESTEIAPGETAELTFAIMCPDTLNEYTVEVNEFDATDYTPVDNAARFHLGSADLTVSASCTMLGRSREVEAIVSNAGIASAGGILTLFDEEGNAVSDAYIPALAAGERVVVLFSLGEDAASGAYSARLESDDETERAYNNSALTYVPDVQYQNMIGDVGVSGDFVQLTVSCGEDGMRILCAFYDEAGQMLCANSENATQGENSYSVPMPEGVHRFKAFLLSSSYVPVITTADKEL